MTLLTRSSLASMDTIQSRFHQRMTGNLYAGEALDAAAPCYIKSSDGKVYMSNGTNADEAAEFAGFTPTGYLVGEAVTLYGAGARFKYGSGLTPGAVYFIGATKGRLDTAATTGDTMGVAMAINSTDILVTRESNVCLNAVADGALTGAKAANVADVNAAGGLPLLHRFDIAAGANGNVDITTQRKERVIDAWLILRGAGVSSETFQVKNGTNAITDKMAASGSDQAIVRAASINDAYWEVAAGGTLRVTGADGASMPDATVFVMTIPVA